MLGPGWAQGCKTYSYLAGHIAQKALSGSAHMI